MPFIAGLVRSNALQEENLAVITLALLVLLLLPFLLAGVILLRFSRIGRRSLIRWCAVAYVATAILVLFGVGPYLAAWAIVHSGTRPQDRSLQATPAQQGVSYEEISFNARDGLKLSGWFIPPTGKDAVLICTHGLFRNRVEMLERIIPVARAGYGALLYDTRSHGTSSTGLISLGFHERNDVLGAIDYVKRRYQDAAEHPQIVLMGVSMGADSTLEAAAESNDYAAIILDSPFLNIRETVARHSWLLLRLPGFPFDSLFLFWLERLARFDPERMNAEKAIARIQPVPLLIIASEGDIRMGTVAARTLHDETKSRLKILKIYGKDVGHGASARIYPGPYSALILQFLDIALGPTSAPGDTGDDETTTSSAAAGSLQ
jgi:pimeloyl-ACP methyl ester carboxylesterase